MSHLLQISDLSAGQVERLLQRAQAFKQQKAHVDFSSHYLANLFYENSTRTRASFTVAATRLQLPVFNLDLGSSSESKGEIINDTIDNLAAMGMDVFVVRHSQEHIQQSLADGRQDIHIINAGDGTHAHPSQALLDFMTILEQKPDLSKVKIALIGNLRHSRVANSLQCLAKIMEVGELVLVAPGLWQPQSIHFGRYTDSLVDGLTDADVIVCLRVQRERLLDSDFLDLNTYRQHYALTPEGLALAKPDAIVMHPGPVNRGIEIDSEVADGRQSVILQQVHNGVFMRMAIIEHLLTTDS